MYFEESIRRIVKDIDPRFDCKFDFRREGYAITQTTPLGAVSQYDFIPWNGLNKAFFDRMRRNVYINRNGNPLLDMLESNEKIQRRSAEREADTNDYLIKSTAPRMQRAVKEV